MSHLNASRVMMVIMRLTIDKTLPAIEKALRGVLSFGGDVRALTSCNRMRPQKGRKERISSFI